VGLGPQALEKLQHATALALHATKQMGARLSLRYCCHGCHEEMDGSVDQQAS